MSSSRVDCKAVSDRLEVVASKLSSTEGQFSSGAPDYANELTRFADIIRGAAELLQCASLTTFVDGMEEALASNDMARFVELLEELRGLAPSIAKLLRARSALLIVNLFTALSVMSISLLQIAFPASLLELWTSSITMGLGVASALLAAKRLSPIILLISSALLAYTALIVGDQTYLIVTLWSLVLSGASLALMTLARSMSSLPSALQPAAQR